MQGGLVQTAIHVCSIYDIVAGGILKRKRMEGRREERTVVGDAFPRVIRSAEKHLSLNVSGLGQACSNTLLNTLLRVRRLSSLG